MLMKKIFLMIIILSLSCFLSAEKRSSISFGINSSNVKYYHNNESEYNRTSLTPSSKLGINIGFNRLLKFGASEFILHVGYEGRGYRIEHSDDVYKKCIGYFHTSMLYSLPLDINSKFKPLAGFDVGLPMYDWSSYGSYDADFEILPWGHLSFIDYGILFGGEYFYTDRVSISAIYYIGWKDIFNGFNDFEGYDSFDEDQAFNRSLKINLNFYTESRRDKNIIVY